MRLPEPLKRILLVRTDRLGDVVLTLPMLPALRQCYPGAYIAVLLCRYTGEIVEGNPYADELIWYDEGQELRPFRIMLKCVLDKKFDAAIVVHPTLRLAWLMFRAGIPLRIGTGYRYYSFLFNRRVFEHRKDARRHEVEYNLNLLKELNCRLEGEPEFKIEIPPHAQVSVNELLLSAGIHTKTRIVILHPGTGGSAREWPIGSFAELAVKLLAGNDVQILVTGEQGDEGKAEEILKATGGKAVSLTGRLKIKELAALIRSASLFVSNSTGPLHIAVALGTPVVAMYPQLTAMSPARWGPYTENKRVFVPNKPTDCKECSGVEDSCACMASISVEDVYTGARLLLSKKSTHSREILTHG